MCAVRYGATNRARRAAQRKHASSCSVSVLRRVAGELASNRTRSGCCDGVFVPYCSQRLSASFHAKKKNNTNAHLSPLEGVPRGEGVNYNQESPNGAELFYRRQQIATRDYEACRLTAGHNNHRWPNYRNFSSSVSCRQLQITTTPSLRNGNKALSSTSYPPPPPIQKAASSAQQLLQNQYCI
jgi:hypothetical protein